MNETDKEIIFTGSAFDNCHDSFYGLGGDY